MLSFAFFKISPSFIFLKYYASFRNYLHINSECSSCSLRQEAIIYQESQSDGDAFWRFACLCVCGGWGEVVVVYYLNLCPVPWKASVRTTIGLCCVLQIWGLISKDLEKKMQLSKVQSRNSLWILNLCCTIW